VFTILSNSGRPEDAIVAALSLASGEIRPLVRGATSARYLPSGHLAYVQGSNLMVVPFDLGSMRATGPALLAEPGIRTDPESLVGHFDLAEDGTLVYLASGFEPERRLAWIGLGVAVRTLPFPPRPYMHPRLLPGRQGLVVEIEDAPHNLWYGDLRSGTLTQLTREGANHRPVVSPDGRRMAFSSDRVSPRSLFLQATDGSRVAERLPEAKHPQNPTAWSRDGRLLAYTETHPETGDDIWILPLEGERRPYAFLNSSSSEGQAVFSPDGRWLAYESNESGRREVLVTAFPGPGPRQQASTNGGDMPAFSPDGRRLYYRQGDQVMAVDIASRTELALSAPRVICALPGLSTGVPAPLYDVVEGDSILAVDFAEPKTGVPRVEIVVDWLSGFRQRSRATE
jgi:dipeptidyl aminopeptidase/acylaminoacyl peptidase